MRITVEQLVGSLYGPEHAPGAVFPHDVAGYAAYDAAKALAQNWQDATRDGTPLADVLHDVDDVIAVLAAWRDAVRERLCPPAAPPQPVCSYVSPETMTPCAAPATKRLVTDPGNNAERSRDFCGDHYRQVRGVVERQRRRVIGYDLVPGAAHRQNA